MVDALLWRRSNDKSHMNIKILSNQFRLCYEEENIALLEINFDANEIPQIFFFFHINAFLIILVISHTRPKRQRRT